jgi:TonB-linked SusC/RagA family outer membrane protein
MINHTIRYSKCLYKTLRLGFVMALGLFSTLTFGQDADTTKATTALPFKAEKYPNLFFTQSEAKQVGAISFLKGNYLESTPTNFIGNAMSGRLNGLINFQLSGQPGGDGVSFNVRGRAPIVYVDGVPRPSTLINPEQIESITVLKDALSTNMMGIRSMNGAILITTKKGDTRSNYFTVNATAQRGVQTPLKVRETLSAADYATLYNEALANDGREAIYSQADIDAYKTGKNPFTHPNVNWNDEILNKSAGFDRYTVGAEGSSKFVNYAMSLDYMNQEGLLKPNDINPYSTNSEFQRYIFRTNVTANITDNFSVFLNLFGRVRNTNDAGGGTDEILESIKTTPNNAYPIYNPNKSLGGSVNYTDNIFAQSTLSGYTKRNLRDGFADAGFNVKLDNILEGWWVKGLISFNTAVDQTINRTKNFEVFKMNIGTANDTTYQRFGTATPQSNSSTVDVSSRQIYSQIFTGLNRSFGDNSLDVLLTSYIDNSISNGDLPNTFKTSAARIQYTRSEKYIAEASLAYSGNNRFAEGKQYGFFPAAGVAWNMHKEAFLEKLSALNLLKLRATYGLIGNANPGYFLFQENYVSSGSYIFGATPGSASGLALTTLPSIRTYEQGNKMNIGFDAELFNNHIFISTDYYKNNLDKMLISKGAASSILGLSYPLENLGKYAYSGIELNIGYANQMSNGFSYDISGNMATQKSNLVYNDAPNMPYAWMNQVGLPVGQVRGYIADGFVTKAGEGPVVEGYKSVAGDIKYKDLNSDGVINLYDRTGIGPTKPSVYYGLNLNVKFKGFYAGFLIQGVKNNQILLLGNDTWEFQSSGRGQAYPHHLNRWTSATASTADYPRLSVGANPNNHVTSTFWLQNGDFLRLKNAEIGYNFTGGFIEKLKLKNLRVFANGFNLLTFSKFKRFDPEMPGANYSTQRIVNGGINVGF